MKWDSFKDWHFVTVFIVFLVVISKYEWLSDSMINSIVMISGSYFAMRAWHKDKKFDYLVNIYKKIFMNLERSEAAQNMPFQKDFEEAVCMLQLYGDMDEIKKLECIAKDNKDIIIVEVLGTLRNKIREEVYLSEISTEFFVSRKHGDEGNGMKINNLEKI